MRSRLASTRLTRVAVPRPAPTGSRVAAAALVVSGLVVSRLIVEVAGVADGIQVRGPGRPGRHGPGGCRWARPGFRRRGPGLGLPPRLVQLSRAVRSYGVLRRRGVLRGRRVHGGQGLLGRLGLLWVGLLWAGCRLACGWRWACAGPACPESACAESVCSGSACSGAARSWPAGMMRTWTRSAAGMAVGTARGADSNPSGSRAAGTAGVTGRPQLPQNASPAKRPSPHPTHFSHIGQSFAWSGIFGHLAHQLCHATGNLPTLRMENRSWSE